MKIVIVGGGTAGWLSTLFVSKIKPEHEVVVIESSAIGIVGAGEGSTGTLTDVVFNQMYNFGIDPLEFLRETQSSIKYGIKFKGWTSDIDKYFYSPLAGTPTDSNAVDYVFGTAVNTMGDKLHESTFHGNLIVKDISPIDKDDHYSIKSHALHFDARLVGEYLKKVCMKGDKVKLIDSIIQEVLLNSVGEISSVRLSDGSLVDGDFFIDASGFARVLSKRLDTNWVSYKKHLPVNTAMPFFIHHTENTIHEPYTTAWAQKAGWMWQIPLQTRKGCGYVFSDEFTTHEKAHQEIETILGYEVDPIRFLKFETGRLENVWEKNCLSVGLAAAFAEPLEATSIHSTIVQLHNFVFNFLNPTKEETLNSASIKLYNNRTSKMYDDFKDFLVCHYLGGRNDSEFWRYIGTGETKTEFASLIHDACKTRILSHYEFDAYTGFAGWSIWSFILSGTGQISKEVAIRNLSKHEISLAVNKIKQIQSQTSGLKLHQQAFQDFYKTLHNNKVTL